MVFKMRNADVADRDFPTHTQPPLATQPALQNNALSEKRLIYSSAWFSEFR